MEKAVVHMKVEEDQKTDFSSYFLKGEANYWWESRRALEREDIVTWDRFTELFLEKYFPRYMKNQVEIKFLELKQGNMYVTEYEAKFTKLASFVPELVDTEEKWVKRFQQGLQQWIRSRVAVFELTIYTTVVQKTMIIKGTNKGHYSNECPSGRTKVICFQCGKKGHVVRDGRGPTMAASIPKVLALPSPPQYNQPRARTFNMTIKKLCRILV
ncbi:uncharacterized protein LOC141685766 [Apium graveolens]|uniref:uncharacterized protein LOC141685766 n=1 Tax=Apium graveolens TaxID=4045 RepID=UPI003D7B5AC8